MLKILQARLSNTWTVKFQMFKLVLEKAEEPEIKLLSFIQFSSVALLCLTLFDPMNCSTPGLPVHHQLPEFTQTHVHRVGDAIQPSHPLSSLSPPAPNPSQHQSIFQWVNSLHEVAKVLEFQLQIIEKGREFQKNIYFCFIDYVKAFDCVDQNKLWKILKEMGIADHLTYLLRNLYADQEATVRFGHGTTDWFQIGKGVHQGCMLSPC